VQDLAAADGVSGDHGHHRLRQPADLDVQIAHVEAAHTAMGHLVVADVTVVAADPLVAARTEGLVAGPGEDDRRDVGVVACAGKRVPKLGQGLGAKRISRLRAVDRDLGDSRRCLVADVAVLARRAPLNRGVQLLLRRGFLVTRRHACSSSLAVAA
jgi:hypothetical protein